MSFRRYALLAFALCIGVNTTYAETLTGRVIGIADGDTLTVLDDHFVQHKVRLSGIDAPDMQVPSKKS